MDLDDEMANLKPLLTLGTDMGKSLKSFNSNCRYQKAANGFGREYLPILILMAISQRLAGLTKTKPVEVTMLIRTLSLKRESSSENQSIA